MENEMKRLLCVQRWEYAAFWVLNLAFAALYECDALHQGVLTDQPRTAYMFQVIGVLLTIGMVPFALRLLRMYPGRCLSRLSGEQRLKSYGRWCEVRMVALLVPALFNLTVYYTTLNTSGLLCAGMVALASLFCVPGSGRIAAELNLGDKTSDENKD